MSVQYLEIKEAFPLESGELLPALTIAYTTYGKPNKKGDNVVWVCHALTANADPVEWWPGLVGSGCLIDPAKHFIICANIIGSCYGSTGPTSKNPLTAQAYHDAFPLVTTRDMARAHILLCQHLGIAKIALAIGGSMGGQQVLEWAILEPERFKRLVLLATNAKHSPWGIAFNESQRMAIYADQSLHDGTSTAGQAGLEAARSIAILSYRHYLTYQLSQQEDGSNKIKDFRAASYQRYQGEKLRKRFNVFAYLALSRSMDSHDVGRGRGSLHAALQIIQAETLVIGVETDILFPVQEQQFLATHIAQAKLHVIHSDYGHDGFLTEAENIAKTIATFWRDGITNADRRALNKGRLGGRSFALPGTENF